MMYIYRAKAYLLRKKQLNKEYTDSKIKITDSRIWYEQFSKNDQLGKYKNAKKLNHVKDAYEGPSREFITDSQLCLNH